MYAAPSTETSENARSPGVAEQQVSNDHVQWSIEQQRLHVRMLAVEYHGNNCAESRIVLKLQY